MRGLLVIQCNSYSLTCATVNTEYKDVQYTRDLQNYADPWTVSHVDLCHEARTAGLVCNFKLIPKFK
jgi:hypothetical protein